MYVTVLAAHSYLRWVVLLLAIAAVLRAWAGWRSKHAWMPGDERLNRLFVSLFDLQVLLGLILYVVASPLTRAAFQNFGAAMRDSVLRFFAVEHMFGMLLAVIFVHIGRARSRRYSSSELKHRSTFIFFGLALLAVLASIPWPFMPAGRPLFWGLN